MKFGQRFPLVRKHVVPFTLSRWNVLVTDPSNTVDVLVSDAAAEGGPSLNHGCNLLQDRICQVKSEAPRDLNNVLTIATQEIGVMLARSHYLRPHAGVALVRPLLPSAREHSIRFFDPF